MMATNPVLALQTLREEAEKIKQVPDLAPATRDQLMNTLQAAIGEATRHLTAHEGHRQERQERIAAAKERAVLDDDSAAAGGRVYPVADLVLPLSTTPAAPTGLASLDFQLPQRGQLYQFITPRGEVEITAQAVSSNMMTKLQRLAIALVAILAIGFALRLARQDGVGPLGGPGAITLMICLGVLSVLTGVLPIAGLVLFLSGLVLKIRRAAARSRAARVSPVAKATP